VFSKNFWAYRYFFSGYYFCTFWCSKQLKKYSMGLLKNVVTQHLTLPICHAACCC
jgi:hypothetical protein